ncbi:pyridoxamine 5'-phosphate oxidase [Acinetobacter sp. ANC 5054]|uniref:pyridoxamine 5'-phosphate oxidase n=1 Tax=Acinetobacter sp. ANC 5054 TaxID=1977877 RepID=UPI000A3340F9|nr:pyridoxamine 5'-phosphate oxidase [Acinetobacter sp. ANC 5054]OTG79467.1 pyridoxamine 5'-phosphate oxidase [Acinetobacter sp. ANC 5054]
MNLQDWTNIRKVVADAQRAAMHCSIATVDQQLQPTITPIGTVFLHDDQFSGFFFDRYSEALRENLVQNPKACIQAINSSKLFWLKSLIQGQFRDYPGVRLYVEIGDLRLANEAELTQAQRRIQALKWTKGSTLIWGDFHQVRDFKVHDFRWVEYPEMMPKAH